MHSSTNGYFGEFSDITLGSWKILTFYNYAASSCLNTWMHFFVVSLYLSSVIPKNNSFEQLIVVRLGSWIFFTIRSKASQTVLVVIATFRFEMCSWRKNHHPLLFNSLSPEGGLLLFLTIPYKVLAFEMFLI